MSKKRSFTKIIGLLLLAVFLTQTAACGYFMYPERRGQTQGRLDPAVVVMDGIWLLLFIVPGIIAFAVDFSSGAIYLPGGRADQGDGKAAVVMADPETLDNAALERIVNDQTGLSIDINSAAVKSLGVENPDGVGRVLDGIRQNGYSG